MKPSRIQKWQARCPHEPDQQVDLYGHPELPERRLAGATFHEIFAEGG